MSTEKTITLITGANGGIGFALAALLLESPTATVLLGSRSASKGDAAVQALQARNLPGTVELIVIDVDSEASVEAAAKSVQETTARLDALVNNAAVRGEFVDDGSFAPSTKSEGEQLVDALGRILSIGLRLDDTNPHQAMKYIPYRVSKAALHMVTACQAYEYGPKGWKLFNYCPGHTESNLGPRNTLEAGAKAND